MFHDVRMTERVGLKDEAQILLPAIVARMNNLPFPEQCNYLSQIINDILAEEIRL
jgi:hypothetical protein